ncbi:MAG: hypothetical protein H7338_17710 [Candidatus Sericytochromatia bacterium]|nr:hypothetical protein [Candidatus Sericytochromatia bacterium]
MSPDDTVPSVTRQTGLKERHAMRSFISIGLVSVFAGCAGAQPGQIKPTPQPSVSGQPSPTPSGASVYTLTTFDGPPTAMPGSVTLKATGGGYDFCFNRYTPTQSVNESTRQIRLGVTAVPVPANEPHCLAPAQMNHTFEFPVTVTTTGAFVILALNGAGTYTPLGTLIVSDKPVTPTPYTFLSYDGPTTAKVGMATTVSATGGEYAFCDFAYTPSLRIDEAARTVDLSLIGYPLPNDGPRCEALAQSHTEKFAARFTTAGTYTVRTAVSAGFKAIGTVTVTAD